MKNSFIILIPKLCKFAIANRSIWIINFLLLLSVFSLAQGKYSIDMKSKDRRVPVSYAFNDKKNQFENARVWRKNKRIEDKVSKKTKKHIYSIQTHEVKKRMRKAEKKANNFNRGKVPLGVKLKRIIENG